MQLVSAIFSYLWWLQCSRKAGCQQRIPTAQIANAPTTTTISIKQYKFSIDLLNHVPDFVRFGPSPSSLSGTLMPFSRNAGVSSSHILQKYQHEITPNCMQDLYCWSTCKVDSSSTCMQITCSFSMVEGKD